MNQITVLKTRRLSKSIDRILKDNLPASNEFGYSRSGRGRKTNENHIYETQEKAIENGDLTVTEMIKKSDELIVALSELRTKISNFNKNSEINDLLNQKATLSEKLSAKNKIVKSIQAPKIDTTNNKYAQGCSEQLIESIKLDIIKLERATQEIEDKCAGINANHKLEISNEVWSLLKKYNLID